MCCSIWYLSTLIKAASNSCSDHITTSLRNCPLRPDKSELSSSTTILIPNFDNYNPSLHHVIKKNTLLGYNSNMQHNLGAIEMMMKAKNCVEILTCCSVRTIQNRHIKRQLRLTTGAEINNPWSVYYFCHKLVLSFAYTVISPWTLLAWFMGDVLLATLLWSNSAVQKLFHKILGHVLCITTNKCNCPESVLSTIPGRDIPHQICNKTWPLHLHGMFKINPLQKGSTVSQKRTHICLKSLLSWHNGL